MGQRTIRGHWTAQAALAAAGLLLGLLTLTTPAQASFEQTGCFAGSFPGPTESCKPVAEEAFTEEVQLGGVSGMAVNINGAGGVPKGTVYAATMEAGENPRVAMYVPEGQGLHFSLGWEVTAKEEAYKRCGPDLQPTPTKCPLRVETGQRAVDVAVDQATGNVYVYNGTAVGSPEFRLITVYTPDGSKVLAKFGKRAAAESISAENAGEIHSSGYPGAIAVRGEGEVLLFDTSKSAYHRLMVFKPEAPGDYEHYAYAGEVAAGPNAGTEYPTQPVTDAAGNVYVTAEGEVIKMFAPEAPAAYPAPTATPTCTFKYPKGGITAITVNPQSGEVFFGNLKKESTLKWVRELGPCNEATHKFEASGIEIVDKFGLKPERADPWGLAFDPVRQLAGRPAGVLYGGAPGAIPDGTGAGEPGQSSLGYVFAGHEDKESPPVVQSQSVTKVTATSAVLRTQIDPKGIKTTYAFQYIAEAAYEANPPGERFAGAQEAPPGGAALEGTQGSQSAATTLTGLSPETSYRYRVLATSNCASSEPSKVCTVPGAAQGFHTFPEEAPGLPDDRAYELVSPAQKQGGQVLPADPRVDSCGEIECKPGGFYTRFPMQSTPDGEAIAYEGTPFGDEGGVIENQYVARRDPKTGWQNVNPTPPLLFSSKNGAGYKALSTDLGEGILEQLDPVLSPLAPPGYPNLYSQPTADPLALSPLVGAEPPNRPGSQFKLDYAGAATDLSRVFFAANDALTEEVAGIAPEAVDGGTGKSNLYEWDRETGQLRLVNVAPDNATSEPGASFGAGSAHAISTDGSRAFWSDSSGQLYVREDAEATGEIPGSGKFLSAATDGSRVLLDSGSLYDLETEETTDLTNGKGGFLGLVGQSDDLSHAYFVDTAVLDASPNAQGDAAEAGKDNLYAWDEGNTRFVAQLLAGDNNIANVAGFVSRDWSYPPSERTAQASPGGGYLAFLSTASLTGYDNVVGPCKGNDGQSAGPCREAFLYDSATDELTCASCNPSGAKPLGHSNLRLILGPSFLPLPRYLTDEGRLYFDSGDSLTPFDTNEGVEDVYEFEPNEVGSCEREAGCLSLISAGSEAVDSNLLTIDESGANVFFTTRDRLKIKDKDELIDLYDAREDGGIAAETEVTEPECQGEACQPPVSVPNDPTPGSSNFVGPGNAAKGETPPARCKKPKVRRHGRCVARKHHKRAGRQRRQANHDRGGMK